MRGSRGPWAYGSLRVGIKVIFKLMFDFFTVLGWPTLTRLRRHSFPHDQSLHEVFKEATVETYIFMYIFLFFFSLYVFLPSEGRGGSVAYISHPCT